MLQFKISTQRMRCDYYDIRAMKARLQRAFNEGMGSVMSLQGGYLSMPSISQKNDIECIRYDWECVGKDLEHAMRKFKK